MNSPVDVGIPYMFLLPALATAVVSELVYAGVATETHTEPKSYSAAAATVPRPHVPFRAVVDPVGNAHPDSMSDKQLVVFGTEKHPGINTAVLGPLGEYTGWQNQLSQTQFESTQGDLTAFPLAWTACEYTVKSVLPSFTPNLVIQLGTDLCFRAAKNLWKAGKALTFESIKKGVISLWDKMPSNKKSVITKPQAVKAAKAVSKMVPRNNRVGASMLRVTAPAANSNVVGRTGAPKTKSTTRGIVVTHSEMVGTLVSNSTALYYSARNFVVNPAKSDIFPWLSSMATQYDKYRIRRCIVHLVSMQPTSMAGRMGIAYDPDSTDGLPADRTEVYAMYRHVEGPLWQSMALELPVSKKELFCNTHTTADSKLIDDGQIIVFSDAVPAPGSATLADIIVEYTVELLDPQQALFCTSYMTLGGISATGGQAITPLSIQGPSYVKFYTADSQTFYCIPSPGYYAIHLTMYDSGAGSPGIVIHNGTPNAMYSIGAKNTTIATVTIYVKISSNSTAATTFTGDYLSFKTSLANLATLEAIKIDVTRIAPPIWTTSIPADLLSVVTTAAGGDFTLA